MTGQALQQARSCSALDPICSFSIAVAGGAFIHFQCMRPAEVKKTYTHRRANGHKRPSCCALARRKLKDRSYIEYAFNLGHTQVLLPAALAGCILIYFHGSLRGVWVPSINGKVAHPGYFRSIIWAGSLFREGTQTAEAAVCSKSLF